MENISKRKVPQILVGIRARPPKKTPLKGNHSISYKLSVLDLKIIPRLTDHMQETYFGRVSFEQIAKILYFKRTALLSGLK